MHVEGLLLSNDRHALVVAILWPNVKVGDRVVFSHQNEQEGDWPLLPCPIELCVIVLKDFYERVIMILENFKLKLRCDKQVRILACETYPFESSVARQEVSPTIIVHHVVHIQTLTFLNSHVWPLKLKSFWVEVIQAVYVFCHLFFIQNVNSGQNYIESIKIKDSNVVVLWFLLEALDS